MKTTWEQDIKRLRSFLNCCAVALAMLMRYKFVALSECIEDRCSTGKLESQLLVFGILILCCGRVVVTYALTYVKRDTWKKLGKR